MANYVSIGVFSKLTDLSQYVEAVPGTVGYIAIVSDRGPDNMVLPTNRKDFFRVYGRPNINYAGSTFGFGPYVASRFLAQSDSLYVTRVMPTDAAFANLVVNVDTTTGNVSTSSVVGASTVTAFGTAYNADPSQYMIFYGEGRGEFYEKFKLEIINHTNTAKRDEGIYLFYVYKQSETKNPSTGSLDYNLAYGPFEISFNPDALDDSGDSMFIGTITEKFVSELNVYYDYNRTKTLAAKNPLGTPPGPIVTAAFASPVLMANGSDGSLFDISTGQIDSAVVTPLLTNAYKGALQKHTDGTTLMTEVLNTEIYLFSVIFDAGYPAAVKTEIVALAQTRDDSIAVVDNGDNISITESVNSRTTLHTYNTKNAMIGDIYSKVYDSFTGKDIWAPPSYHIARLIPFTDNIANIHTSFAGPNRGTLSEIKEVRYSPNLSERDTLYLNQLNPIVMMNIGPMLWDQLTSQKRPSKLQQVHIVRLYLYIKRALENFSRYYVHEKNHSDEYSRINDEVTAFLTTVKNERGLNDFSVAVGASDYQKKLGHVQVDVTLDPTTIIRQIHLNFMIK